MRGITLDSLLNFSADLNWPKSNSSPAFNLYVLYSWFVNSLTTLPFLSLTNDHGFSYLEKDRKKLLKSSHIIKKLFNKKLISYLRIPYYLSYIPYCIKYKNLEYYYEHYSKKYLVKLKNIFSHLYIDINKIHFDENYYAEDLKKFVKKFKI